MAMLGKGTICILEVHCMLKAEEHQATWGWLKPRTKSPHSVVGAGSIPVSAINIYDTSAAAPLWQE